MGNYKEISSVLQIDTMLAAFALGAYSCVQMFNLWRKEHEIKHTIECIFEDGDFGRGKFIDMMRHDKFVSFRQGCVTRFSVL
jgi:hypothetical protein